MKKIVNFVISVIATLIVLALCIYAIHDIQTAEGIGYYFCLKLNAPSRTIFDIAADVVFFILLMVLLLIPFMGQKKKTWYDFSAFTLLFVSFIPTISTAYVFGLFLSADAFIPSMDTEVLSMNFIDSFRILIPVIVLLAGINYVVKNKKPEKADWLMMICAFALVLISIPFPGLYSLVHFIVTYLFILVIFRLMKELRGKMWLLHIILFFTAIYRIITACQSYTL